MRRMWILFACVFVFTLIGSLKSVYALTNTKAFAGMPDKIEESDKGKKLDWIFCWNNFLSVNINRVAQGLKCVKTNSDR